MSGTCFKVGAFESRVCAFVAARGVLRAGEHPLLMLSGGPDSMCLLNLLPVIDRRLGLGLRAAALHVDYGLRGGASDRDRELVEAACAAAGLTLHVERLAGRLSGRDFQARARRQRYDLARELAARYGYGPLVTAHNRDDQAETVLYRLVKYASPLGLAGMRPREADLARPLLGAGADEIRAYCAARAIAYGVDATNLEPVYARNAIRLDVLPALARLNPRVLETLADAASIAAAEADVVAGAVDAAWDRVRVEPRGDELAALNVGALAAEAPALRALCLRRLAASGLETGALVTRRQVAALERLADRRAGAGRAALRGGREALRDSDRLAVRRRCAAHECADAAVALRADAPTATVFCGRRVTVELRRGAHPPGAGERRLRCACPAPPAGVTVRHPRRGERFTPYGRSAATTVARFLAAAGCPRDERARALLLDLDGAVAAVVFTDRAGRTHGRVAQERSVTQSTEWTVSVALEGP